MAKCVKCNKLITKKIPGLQCMKCNKWVHGTCASLSSDQLSVLFSTESADWKCRNCAGICRPKRLSFIMPDQEEENNDKENLPKSNYRESIMNDIRSEIREIMQTELHSVLQFYIDRMDEYESKIQRYENQIRDLTNHNKNMDLKVSVLQQKMNNHEQNMLQSSAEVHGIEEKEGENITDICLSLCQKLNEPTGLHSNTRIKVFTSLT
ncbi:unnamed protein product [Leptosia nina]|uniref:Zinc finger PHD-type domain-containing protein n=1 Tax=Leptosia nina TaxID=320188 RepID=A0AAV1JWM2_9NEOP